MLHNSFVFNTATTAVSITVATDKRFIYNTIVEQKGEQNSGGVYVGKDSLPEINYNNFAIGQGYEVYNANVQSSTDLNVKNNWWGSTNSALIEQKIYDFFDNASLGVADYSGYLSSPEPDAPPMPPTGLQVSVAENHFVLNWNANQESDLAGYKVYYDQDGKYPFGDTGINVGNVTQFSLYLPTNTTYYFTVLAYDKDGESSWYSLDVVNGTPTPTPTINQQVYLPMIVKN